MSLRHLVTAAIVTSVGVLLALGCSSTPEETVCTKTGLGQSCVRDNDCCSGNCRWQGGGYCQDAKLPPPACQEVGKGCTQGKHCCSGVCENGACLGVDSIPSPPTLTDGGQCGLPGASCGAGSQCCSGVCAQGACAGATGGGGGGGGGGNCVDTNGRCSIPSQCCRGICRDSKCL
jgi:hypothetical protein